MSYTISPNWINVPWKFYTLSYFIFSSVRILIESIYRRITTTESINTIFDTIFLDGSVAVMIGVVFASLLYIQSLRRPLERSIRWRVAIGITLSTLLVGYGVALVVFPSALEGRMFESIVERISDIILVFIVTPFGFTPPSDKKKNFPSARLANVTSAASSKRSPARPRARWEPGARSMGCE